MARTKNTVANSQLAEIKHLVEITFGNKILQYSDCLLLSSDILRKTGIRISSQTIRRFFGLIKNSTSVSLSTLNTLSKYSGYTDWYEFSKSTPSNLKWLSNEEVEMIYEFYNTRIEPSKDINFYQASFVMAQRIIKSKYSEKLLYDLAKNKTAQTFFYEMFPFIDDLAGIYQKGILYYLESKKTVESNVYSHSLLFLKAFLTKDSLTLENEFRSLSKIKINFSIHPLPVARFAGSHLLYYKSVGNKKLYNEWLNKCTERFANIYLENHPFSCYFPGYHFMMINYLLLAKEFDIAAVLFAKQDELLELCSMNSIYASHVSNVEIKKLHNAIILAFTDKVVESKKVFKEINVENIWVFEKKYYSIWYLILQLRFTSSFNKRKIILQQANNLIEATKFEYFRIFINEYL